MQTVLDLFNPLFTLEDYQFHVHASIGISIYPDHSTDSNTLIEYADVDMFESDRVEFIWNI
ncbi:GGDEF domain-containing protein [Sporosarcina psychrophila]|uniref:GGDEF domain-containing protein n=1 Tax=Sporosarcina psychrophila TaxID=1476 RepID=A0ABV2K3R3_SPOPS